MKTYNTIVTSKEVKTLENVLSRCPYECVKLDENKYGFMDNENGDIRNYFCDTLGYECSDFEAFDFEYLEKPQTVEPSKPNFYTSNGWRGSKYDIKKGAKEVAKELRAYIKANPDLNACKWSIRSKWGMIADSLYISLMAAPFDPFTEEYKTRHEYRYERGYSEHGTVKDYTSPEAYKLMMKVKTFVIQYIHDDSDGMIDYYDRNIYDHYEIGQYDKPFKMIEKKENPKHGEPSSEPNGAKTSEPVAVIEGLEIVDYSEKAIAVFGETKAIKDELKALGGKFNPALKYNGEKRSGWIFSKKQADKVKELIVPALPEAGQKEVAIKEGDLITFKADSFQDSEVYRGIVEYKEQLGFVVYVNGVQYELRKVLNIKKLDNSPLIIADYAKYDSFDYPTIPEELDGFKLGEIVYDQCGEIGVILAFNEKNGTARLDSNGCCDVGRLKKCPKEIAEKEVERMDIIRPEKQIRSTETDVKIFEQSDNFFKIVKRLRENIKKGHSKNTIKKNIKSLRNLVHDEFFRVVTVPYFSKHPSIPRVNREVVAEFLLRVDKLTKGDNVENDLSKISRFSSIYSTCEEINKELNEPKQPIEAESGQTAELLEFAKASKEFVQEWRKNNPYIGSNGLEALKTKFNRDYSEFAERFKNPNENGVISYAIPNPYPVEKGEYKETELDRQKNEADILLESIDGNFYTIRLNRRIDLKSKRIRQYGDGCISVPESVFNKLKGEYNVMCNF